jgi:hypothetical protein
MKLTTLAGFAFDDRCDDFHSGRPGEVCALLDAVRRIAHRLRDETASKPSAENDYGRQKTKVKTTGTPCRRWTRLRPDIWLKVWIERCRSERQLRSRLVIASMPRRGG